MAPSPSRAIQKARTLSILVSRSLAPGQAGPGPISPLARGLGVRVTVEPSALGSPFKLALPLARAGCQVFPDGAALAALSRAEPGFRCQCPGAWARPNSIVTNARGRLGDSDRRHTSPSLHHHDCVQPVCSGLPHIYKPGPSPSPGPGALDSCKVRRFAQSP
jgi:hypothetical protein